MERRFASLLSSVHALTVVVLYNTGLMKLLLRNVNVIRSSTLGVLVRTGYYTGSSRNNLSGLSSLGSRTIKRPVYAPTENPPGYRLSICRLQSTTRTSRSLGIAPEMRPVAVLKKEAIPSSIAKEDSVRTKEPSYTSLEESGHAGKQNQSRTRIEAERQPPSLSQNIEMNGRDMKVDILNLKDDVVSNSAAPVLRNKSGNRLGRQGTEGSHEERRTLLREIHNVRRVSSDNVEIFPPKRQHSFRDDVGHAAAETFLLTRLTFNLLRYLGVGYRWITKFLALGLYAIFLMPGFMQVGYKYFFSKNVHRSIVYGAEPRNRLDLYMPEDTSEPKPVVIFITGGAWIIGYKAWGALFGLQLCERDIMVCCVDYRNFPQGGISDMVEDVSTGIGFIVNNIRRYGGDPDRIFLGGQSAGSHIAACCLIEQARIEIGQKEGVMTWKPSQIKAFLGLSGGYNLPKLVDHFHKRGLYRSIFLSIMEGETSLPLYSPELAVRSNAFAPAVNLLPTMYLFHGTADYSIPYEASVMFGNALRDVGATVVTKFYADKTHTDVFLQDPMRGGYDALFEDLVAVVHADDEEATAKDAQASLRPRLVPEFLLRLARVVSPF